MPIWSHWCCCYLFFHFEQRPTMTTTMLSSSSIRISWFWSIIYLCSFRFFLVRIHFVQFDWFGCFLFACCLFRLLGLVFFFIVVNFFPLVFRAIVLLECSFRFSKWRQTDTQTCPMRLQFAPKCVRSQILCASLTGFYRNNNKNKTHSLW